MAFSATLLNRLSAASAALSDRQRARFTSERVSAEDENTPTSATTNNNTIASPNAPADTAALVAAEEGTVTTAATTAPGAIMNLRSSVDDSSVPEGEHETEAEEDDDDDDLNLESPEIPQGNDDMYYRTTMTLAELEEERELARRRMSACVLLTVFVLFKLWIDCIEEPSLPLLMVCLIGTSWTARWIRYNREREEELDRRIAQYLQANQAEAETGGVMDRNDLRMLSFQAQLALAIMESQRHMMEGGRPEGENQTPGVSDAAKEHWQQVSFHDDSPPQYGSVKDVDGPHCSICLCEYEEGDKLTKLPCGHLYHHECIESWTSNHTKCPLCNLELESVVDESSTQENNIV